MLGKITPQSGNGKLGPIPVTSRAQGTCPTTCLFYGNGCYGENRGANPQTLFALAEQGETVHDVDTMTSAFAKRGNRRRFRGRDLRRVLPIARDREVGDVLTPDGAAIDLEWMYGVALAGMRAGLRIFGYTHVPTITELDVPPNYVLNASCETPEDIESAWMRGLPAVCVGDRDTLSALMPGVRFVSCPAESRDITCAECGLCAKESRMLEPEKAPVIVFRPHGTAARKVWAAVAARLSGRGA